MNDEKTNLTESSSQTAPDPKMVSSDGSVMPPYRCIIPICRIPASGISIEGTAFFVAPQVLLTARHVLYDQEKRLDELFALLLYGDNHYLKVSLQVIHEDEARDVAVCGVERPKPKSADVTPFVFHCARLADAGPAVGSSVRTYAYHRSIVVEREGMFHASLNASDMSGKALEPVTRKGVSQITANFKLEGLSSGGPLFNEDGHVCGINSSSFDFGEPGRELSFFASVADFRSVRFTWHEREMTLDDLVTGRLVARDS